MADQAALLNALRLFATRSVEHYDLDATLEDVTQQAREVLALDGAGLTLSVQGGTPTQYIAATDTSTMHVEREQDRLQEGPCIDCMSVAEPVHVTDIASVDRWPDYKPIVLAAGFRACAGIPMLAGGRVVGALNAYAAQPREWVADDVDAAQLLANIASSSISNAKAYEDKALLAAQLQHALDSRVVIEQAKGIIAERYGVSMVAAFEALRRHARNQRAKIVDIANDVLTNRQTVEPRDQP